MRPINYDDLCRHKPYKNRISLIMKRITILVLATLLLSACSKDESTVITKAQFETITDELCALTISYTDKYIDVQAGDDLFKIKSIGAPLVVTILPCRY